MLRKNKKRRKLKALFALEGVLEIWEMCRWKVLEFFVQKRVRTLLAHDT